MYVLKRFTILHVLAHVEHTRAKRLLKKNSKLMQIIVTINL